MITASAARALLAIASGFVLSSCVLTSNPVVTSAPEATVLKKRFTEQMRELELATGKRYRGKTIHINAPVPAIYRDWRKMPVAKIRGRRQGGLTSWRSSIGHTSVSLAEWRGQTPDWLVRHEALHAVLLSHGITGHPSRYAGLFGKSYWWMPEAYYRDKARAEKLREKNKGKSRPLLRTVFKRSKKDKDETLAGCCPMCGIDYEALASADDSATFD
ncbi:MAG: hypothetical protein ACI9UA_000171 [Pseudoalteromonas tetraodonis]|jgi:hypothetical protein